MRATDQGVAEILAQAHRNLAKRDRMSGSQADLVYKARDDAVVCSASAADSDESAASGSELSWQDWVDARLDEYGGKAAEVIFEWCGSKIAALKRELESTRDEVRVLREQLGVARELEGLRSDVKQARADIPRVPALVAQLERNCARLKSELAATREKLKTVKVNQSIADYRLAQLDKTTRAAQSEMAVQVERTVASFQMREMHPDAAHALRQFADEALSAHRRPEVVIAFDTGPAAGTP